MGTHTPGPTSSVGYTHTRHCLLPLPGATLLQGVHTHTYAHTCTHTDTLERHAHTHTHTGGVHTHGHIHTHRRTHRYTKAHRHTPTHGHTHRHTHTRTLEHCRCALMSIQGQAQTAPGTLARADFVAGLAHFPINAQPGGKEPTVLPPVGRPPPPLPPTHALLLWLRRRLWGAGKRGCGGVFTELGRAPCPQQVAPAPACRGGGRAFPYRCSACGSVLGPTYLSRAAGRKPLTK